MGTRSTFIGRVFGPRGPHLHHEPRSVADGVADDDDQRQFDGLQLGRRDGRRRRRTAAVVGASTAAGRARLRVGRRRRSSGARHGPIESLAAPDRQTDA